MKAELEVADIQAIATEVINKLVPLFEGTRRVEPDEIMDVKSLSEFLKVNETWVYKQIEYKSIPHFHAGRYPRFKRSEIERWVKEHSTPAVTNPYPVLRIGRS